MHAQRFLDRLTPQRPAASSKARLDVPFGDDGVLAFGSSWELEWSREKGPRVVGRAELRWPSLGQGTPLFVGNVAVEVLPSLHAAPKGDLLVIGLRVLDAEAGRVSSSRAHLLERVNEAIEAGAQPMAWTFSETLARWLAISGALESLEAVGLRVPLSHVAVTHDAVALAASLSFAAPDPSRQTPSL